MAQQQKRTLDEEIFVVQTASLFAASQRWHGIKNDDLEAIMKTINSTKEFHPRCQMEEDPKFKQIIPYLVFNHKGKYFLMQRKASASEQRLRNKFSLGIGGHIRKEDITSNDIFEWAQREFHEEVAYNGALDIELLGILNDDSNEVGRVHLGLVLLLTGEHDAIKIKSELKSGALVTLQELQERYEHPESWSQLVADALIKF